MVVSSDFSTRATPGQVPSLSHGPAHDKPQQEGHDLQVIESLCVGCNYCLMACPHEALVVEAICTVLQDKCTDCLRCLIWCPTGALVYE